MHAKPSGRWLRLVVAGPGSLAGRFPEGNSGRARVSMFAPMPIPVGPRADPERLAMSDACRIATVRASAAPVTRRQRTATATAHGPALSGQRFALWFSVGANSVLLAVQVVVGLVIGSLALLADSLHNASDVVALVIALVGQALAARPATCASNLRPRTRRDPRRAGQRHGPDRADRMGRRRSDPSLLRTGVARRRRRSRVIGVIGLAGERRQRVDAQPGRWRQPEHPSCVLAPRSPTPLGRFGVVVAAAGVYFFDAGWVDPAVSILISVLVLIGVWRLLRDTVGVLLESTPAGLDVDEVTSGARRHRRRSLGTPRAHLVGRLPDHRPHRTPGPGRRRRPARRPDRDLERQGHAGRAIRHQPLHPRTRVPRLRHPRAPHVTRIRRLQRWPCCPWRRSSGASTSPASELARRLRSAPLPDGYQVSVTVSDPSSIFGCFPDGGTLAISVIDDESIAVFDDPTADPVLVVQGDELALRPSAFARGPDVLVGHRGPGVTRIGGPSRRPDRGGTGVGRRGRATEPPARAAPRRRRTASNGSATTGSASSTATSSPPCST